MKSSFIHNPLFRLFAPLLYGSMTYILVLLANDRIAELNENFELVELLFCLLLTWLLSEALRGKVILLERFFPFPVSIRWRVALQLLAGLVVAAFVVSTVVSLYFVYLVGLSTFTSELLVFNIIYGLSSLFYNLLYISIFYLNEQNSNMLQKEAVLRGAVEYRLQAFKNEVNPDLLYSSLETLLSLVHQDKEQVDDYIERLSGFYRFSLDSRHMELVPLSRELQATEHLLYLLNFRHRHLSLQFEVEPEFLQKEIVPGAVSMLVQHVVRNSLISEVHPLRIRCYTEDGDALVLQCPLNERLKPVPDRMREIRDLQQACAWYTSEPVVRVKAYNELILKIPLLSTELEELE